MIHIKESGKQISFTCDTWAEFVQASLKPQLEGGSSSLTPTEIQNFFHYNTWTEAREAFLNKGWPDGWKKLKGSLGQMKHTGSRSFRFEAVFSESGDEPDVDRFLSGEHECMIQYSMQECGSPGQIYRIEINPSASHGFTPDELIMRGLVVLGLYSKIIESGGNCEIHLHAEMDSGSGAIMTINAPIVSSDTPISGERLAFVLCNPDFFRRFILRIMEAHFSDNVRRAFQVGVYQKDGGGYGYPSGFTTPSSKDGVFKVGAMRCYYVRKKLTKDKWPRTPEEAAQTVDKLLSDGLIDNHSTTQAA